MSILAESSLLKNYTDLIGGQTTKIYQHPCKGLFASVSKPGLQGADLENDILLPIKGITEELLKSKSIPQLKKFFECTLLIPVKNAQGGYECVEVRRQGKGGVKSKIPFQPGLALGSIVSMDCIKTMEAFAEAASKREHLAGLIENFEQEIAKLQLQIQQRRDAKARPGRASPQRPADGSPSQDGAVESVKAAPPKEDVLIACWEKHIKSLEAGIEGLYGQLTTLDIASDMTGFSNFQATGQSPIDESASEVVIQPRGFDSLNYSSEFISMEATDQHIQDRVEQWSSGFNANASIGWGLWKVKGSTASARAAGERIKDIRASDTANKILVVNAMMTTRHVRSYKNICYNMEALRRILELMNGDDTEAKKAAGISENNEICLLTEAVMGGSFVGLVIFQKESKIEEDNRRKTEETNRQHTLKVGSSVFGGSVDGSYTGQYAAQSEDGRLQSNAYLNVKVEFFSQGVVHGIARDITERELYKYANLDSEKLTVGQSSGKTTEEQQTALKQVAIAGLTAARAIVSEKGKEAVHTPNNLMQAYENFAEQMSHDAGCGIPVGFNFTVLTKAMIEKKLAESESGAGRAS